MYGVIGCGFPVSKVDGICGALLTSYSIGMVVLATLIFPIEVVGGGYSYWAIFLGLVWFGSSRLLFTMSTGPPFYESQVFTFPGQRGFFLLTSFTPTCRFGNHHWLVWNPICVYIQISSLEFCKWWWITLHSFVSNGFGAKFGCPFHKYRNLSRTSS